MTKKITKTKEEENSIVLNTKELIYQLTLLLKAKDYKKKLPYPKFNIQEARFIRDLIFQKTEGLLFFYLSDYLMNNTVYKHMPMFNLPSLKKLRFFVNFLNLKTKSAKEAAIKAGYSPKTAKQQASRALREIHGYKRTN